MNEPVLSVVLINWNAAPYIAGCLRSVLESDFRDLEIILVDNFSSDGSIDLLKKSLSSDEISRVRITVNEKNYGAAYALNQGAAQARGAYITFLATDTRVEKDCFLELVKVFQRDQSIGAAGAKLLTMQNPLRIDSAGEYLSQFGVLTHRHVDNGDIDKGQFDQEVEIFSVKGTALSVRREVFTDVGGYPQDYFMYLEETDLCWRIWLSGKRIVFVPAARIYHAVGASVKASKEFTYLITYYGTRNYLITLLKNFGTSNLFKIVFPNIMMWSLLACFYTLTGRFKEGWFVAKGVFWNFTHLGDIFKARLKVQRMRVISDRDLMPRIMKVKRLGYLFEKVMKWGKK